MEGRVKFCSGGNVFGASQLKTDEAFSLTTEVDGDLF